MKKQNIILLIIAIVFIGNLKSQEYKQKDTLLFSLIEYTITDYQFLNSFDSLIIKSDFCRKEKENNIFNYCIVQIYQKRDYVYIIDITYTVTPVFSDAFFMVNNIVFFIKGFIPKKIFAISNRKELFSYTIDYTKYNLFDIIDEPTIHLEYYYGTLFYKSCFILPIIDLKEENTE
jgi:hypothetical protein